MKIKYSSDADVLIIELKKGTPVDSLDLREGIILHFNKEKEPIEIELLDASKLTDLEEIGLSLSPKSTVAA
jgi:uncharacterized protein YuzE